MNKAEEFIKAKTRIGSNTTKRWRRNGVSIPSYSLPWLTPDQARKAVEIAREEIIEKACDAYCKVCGHYHHTTPNHVCRQACDYYKDFNQAIINET